MAGRYEPYLRSRRLRRTDLRWLLRYPPFSSTFSCLQSKMTSFNSYARAMKRGSTAKAALLSFSWKRKERYDKRSPKLVTASETALTTAPLGLPHSRRAQETLIVN